MFCPSWCVVVRWHCCWHISDIASALLFEYLLIFAVFFICSINHQSMSKHTTKYRICFFSLLRWHHPEYFNRGSNPLGLYSSVLSKLMVKFWVMFCYSIYCKIYHNWFYDIFRLFWTRLADYGSSIENSFIGYAFMADLENIIWKSYFKPN